MRVVPGESEPLSRCPRGIEDHWKRLAPAFDLSADDSKNVIVALGPAKSLEDLKRLVAMFDVAPMRLRLKVRIEVPRFGFDSTSTVTQGNNQQHLFSEPAVGFEASILPRFNDDSTVTLFVGTDHRGRHDRAIRKLKVGETLRVSAPGSATGSSGAEGIKETVGEALSEGGTTWGERNDHSRRADRAPTRLEHELRLNRGSHAGGDMRPSGAASWSRLPWVRCALRGTYG
ncbi:MAG: hypothetical protein M5U21_11380 [Fimbriimonadaceae bacterium]|nr:hypothetical protein [Fimbriimonadaceae bacterium]